MCVCSHTIINTTPPNQCVTLASQTFIYRNCATSYLWYELRMEFECWCDILNNLRASFELDVAMSMPSPTSNTIMASIQHHHPPPIIQTNKQAEKIFLSYYLQIISNYHKLMLISIQPKHFAIHSYCMMMMTMVVVYFRCTRDSHGTIFFLFTFIYIFVSLIWFSGHDRCAIWSSDFDVCGFCRKMAESDTAHIPYLFSFHFITHWILVFTIFSALFWCFFFYSIFVCTQHSIDDCMMTL